MQKILIANRGEIASRIIKTCKRLGLQTVAVYSEADKDLPFVSEATTAYSIGEPPVGKSYMNVEKIVQIAKQEKVDAVHPGYGFLSENASFAERVESEGMTFIGPRSETIRLMGDKIISRKTMALAGIPIVPGSEVELSTIEEAISTAQCIGFPVILKASGGGGGIGMIRCDDKAALIKNYDATKKRAKTYFGSETVFVEKYIKNARHIEIQIFGDQYGEIVHLFERDCSIQRRHQKVIEETPSPFLSKETREKMCETAIQAAKAVDYVNAGTVEFIVDEKENYYFLEMNTRLQVEHPITEMITGYDLVEWQISISKGYRLPAIQEQIQSVGHAIEFRLYAEDPISFLPSPGVIDELVWRNTDTRVDFGYKAGARVTPFYDPLLGKCIVKGKTRKEAIEKASIFFKGLKISGVRTNAPLFLQILENEEFKKGNYTTSFLAILKKLQ